jgi:hypothetical protein
MSDCGAVVVCDTRENLDGMEKGFGFRERGKRFNTEDTEREERRAQRKKEGGIKPPLHAWEFEAHH